MRKVLMALGIVMAAGSANAGCSYEEVKTYQSEMYAAKKQYADFQGGIDGIMKMSRYGVDAKTARANQRDRETWEARRDEEKEKYQAAEKALYEKCGIIPR